MATSKAGGLTPLVISEPTSRTRRTRGPVLLVGVPSRESRPTSGGVRDNGSIFGASRFRLAPVLTLDRLSPPEGTDLNSSDLITFQVTGIRGLVEIQIDQGCREVAYDGTAFLSGYSESETSPGENGAVVFTLKRSGGWSYPPAVYVVETGL